MYKPVVFFLISFNIVVVLCEGIYIKSDLTGRPVPTGSSAHKRCKAWTYVSNSNNSTIILHDTTCNMVETGILRSNVLPPSSGRKSRLSKEYMKADLLLTHLTDVITVRASGRTQYVH